MSWFVWYVVAFVVVTAIAIAIWTMPAVREKRDLRRGMNSPAARKKEAIEDIAASGPVSQATRNRISGAGPERKAM